MRRPLACIGESQAGNPPPTSWGGTSYGSWYDSSDDNRDDNCSPNNGRYGPFWAYRAWSRIPPGPGGLGIRPCGPCTSVVGQFRPAARHGPERITRKKPEIGVSLATYSNVIQPRWGLEGSNRHGGNRRGQVAHAPGTRGPLRAAGQDASRMGVERDWATLRLDRSTRALPTERRDRLGKKAIQRE